MKTQVIVESLLHITDHKDIVTKCLEISHILDIDRRWYALEHPELFYMDKFKKPMFLIIVDTRIHVYILGEPENKYKFNILKVEGYETTHLIETKAGLRKKLKNGAKIDNNLYLPEPFNKRIIYLDPDYTNNKVNDSNIFIFNKESNKGTLFTEDNWSLGADIYSPNIKSSKLNALNIINAIIQDL